MRACFLKNAAGVLVALAASSSVLGHEFWMDAAPFEPAAGAPVTLTLNVGEYFTGERVGVVRSHALSLRSASIGAEVDLTSLIPAVTMLPSLALSFAVPGSHVLAYESHPSRVVLAADKFHAYLHDEGLDAIVRQREAAGSAGVEGRERFRRSAKTLLRVGGRSDAGSLRSLGQRLEITPLDDPLGSGAGSKLRFSLRFEGQPRPGVLVKAWHKQGPQTTVLRTTTDAGGNFSFVLPFAGHWMLNAVHMTAATDSAEVDWDSYWSSLSFELRRQRR